MKAINCVKQNFFTFKSTPGLISLAAPLIRFWQINSGVVWARLPTLQKINQKHLVENNKKSILAITIIMEGDLDQISLSTHKEHASFLQPHAPGWERGSVRARVIQLCPSEGASTRSKRDTGLKTRSRPLFSHWLDLQRLFLSARTRGLQWRRGSDVNCRFVPPQRRTGQT